MKGNAICMVIIYWEYPFGSVEKMLTCLMMQDLVILPNSGMRPSSTASEFNNCCVYMVICVCVA